MIIKFFKFSLIYIYFYIYIVYYKDKRSLLSGSCGKTFSAERFFDPFISSKELFIRTLLGLPFDFDMLGFRMISIFPMKIF